MDLKKPSQGNLSLYLCEEYATYLSAALSTFSSLTDLNEAVGIALFHWIQETFCLFVGSIYRTLVGFMQSFV